MPIVASGFETSLDGAITLSYTQPVALTLGTVKMVVAPINHVSVDEYGCAFVSGTSIKVTDIVADAYTWNLTPNRIQDNYPTLSLAEIHAALAYYHDHRDEIDHQIAESEREYKRLRASNRNPLARSDFDKRAKTRGR